MNLNLFIIIPLILIGFESNNCERNNISQLKKIVNHIKEECNLNNQKKGFFYIDYENLKNISFKLNQRKSTLQKFKTIKTIFKIKIKNIKKKFDDLSECISNLSSILVLTKNKDYRQFQFILLDIYKNLESLLFQLNLNYKSININNIDISLKNLNLYLNQFHLLSNKILDLKIPQNLLMNFNNKFNSKKKETGTILKNQFLSSN